MHETMILHLCTTYAYFPCIMHKFDGNKRKFLLNICSNNTKADTSRNLFQLMTVQKCIFSSKNSPFSKFNED